MASNHKRAELDKAEKLEQVAHLHRWGHSQREIAEKLGISQPQVSKDLKELREMSLAEAVEDRQVMVKRELAFLYDIRRMALEAFERGKEDIQKRSEETTTTDNMDAGNEGSESGNGTPGEVFGKKGKKLKNPEEKLRVFGRGVTKKVREMTEGRLPPPEYLNIALETDRRISALMGLDEAAKIELKGVIAQVMINWDRLYGQGGENPSTAVTVDPIRLALEQALTQAAKEQTGKTPEQLRQEREYLERERVVIDSSQEEGPGEEPIQANKKGASALGRKKPKPV